MRKAIKPFQKQGAAMKNLTTVQKLKNTIFVDDPDAILKVVPEDNSFWVTDSDSGQ